MAVNSVMIDGKICAPLEYMFPAYKLPPMPTPPVTVNAPVVVDVAEVVDAMLTAPVLGIILKLLVVYSDNAVVEVVLVLTNTG